MGYFIPHLPGASPLLLAALYILALIPLAIDGYTQYRGTRESNNVLRFITGFLPGALGGIIIAYLLKNLLSVIL